MTYSLHKECSPNHPDQELWKQQREERGFDDTELWNLDSTIAQFILPRLKRFKEMTDKYPNPDFSSMEEWNEALDKMIGAFHFMVEEKYGCFDGPMFEDAEEGLRLFAQYFGNLWL